MVDFTDEVVVPLKYHCTNEEICFVMYIYVYIYSSQLK